MKGKSLFPESVPLVPRCKLFSLLNDSAFFFSCHHWNQEAAPCNCVCFMYDVTGASPTECRLLLHYH